MKGLAIAVFVSALIATFGVAPAAALPFLSGSYSISDTTSSSVTWTNNSGTATSLVAATSVVFSPSTNNFVVGNATGDFSGLGGHLGSIKNFTFAGAGGTIAAPTILTFENVVGGLTFDLTQITSVIKECPDSSCTIPSMNLSGQPSALTVSGVGVFHMTGFADTTGTFVFIDGGQAGQSLSFSASQGASVPEPATLLLLGSALLVVGAVAWKRARK